MMKSVRFLVVTAVVSMVLAYVIAPPDPWTYRYPLRVLVILLAVIPTYLIGRAHGRESQKGGQVGGGIWLQFSIRALLLGTALFAIFLGVYCERARRQMYFREALEASGAEVFYESEFDGTPWSNMKMQGLIAGKTPRPPRLTWLRELLGRDYVDSIVAVTIGTGGVEDAIPLLKNLPHLRTVYLPTSSFEPLSEDETRAIERDSKKLRRELPHVELQGTGISPIVG